MTLTNRLTLFSLAALGVVLVAFSGAMYLLAWTYLLRQADERAAADLDTLVAAAELEPDGLEWDRGEHTLWSAHRLEPAVWAIFDAGGREVDGDPDHVGLLQPHAADGGTYPFTVSWRGENWRVYRRTATHPSPNAIDRRPLPGEPHIPGDERYRTLAFVVAVPLGDAEGTLTALAWGLGGVSLALWLAAGVVGRWVCRRALAPIRRMTEAAERITAADTAERLPMPATRDELHTLAGSFNAVLARLHESFDRQRRFTAEASHQLRTPLTAMLGQMEVALRRDRDADEYKRALTTAVVQAGRLREIVEALLFLARADAEAAMPGLETVDLVGLLGRLVADEWKDHPRSPDLRLEHPVGDTLTVVAHASLLGQAVNNLIDNACKYSPPGTPVHIRLDRESGWARVIVRDEGQGVVGGETGRLFEPFFRTEDARRSGIAGAGLGLAVTARIVAVFRGRVSLVPNAGRGCVVEVRLPLAAPPGAGVEDSTTPTPHDRLA